MYTARDRLTRTTFSLPLSEIHALVGGAVNARPLLFLPSDRALTTFVDRMRKAEVRIATPLLQLHGSDDGCIVSPTDRGPSVVRGACSRGRAEPRSLPAHRSSHHDRRPRRPLVGVALRVRRDRCYRELLGHGADFVDGSWS